MKLTKNEVKALDVDGAFAIRPLVQVWENRQRSGLKSDNLSDVFDGARDGHPLR